MSRALPVLLLLLALADPVGAKEAEEAPAVRGRPMTAMAAGILAKARSIVLARVREVRTRGGGLQIAHVAVERTLRGDVQGTLTVLVGGPRPTDDRTVPSTPYLEAHPKHRFVLFLTRGAASEAWMLLTAISADGDIGKEKLAALERHVELAGIPDPRRRARRSRDFLLESLSARGTWTRVHAARELHHLLTAAPEVFDAATLAALDDRARKARLPAQRQWLSRLLERLALAPPPAPADLQRPGRAKLRQALTEATSEDERVETLRQALERGGTAGLPVVLQTLQEEVPAIRVRILDLLAAGGWHDVVDPIRRLYAQEESPEVQRAIVRAVGRLGRQREVAWLVARTRSLRVRREALFALARIRTPEARNALVEVREGLRKETVGAEDSVALIDYLLGPAFDRIERSRGRVPR